MTRPSRMVIRITTTTGSFDAIRVDTIRAYAAALLRQAFWRGFRAGATFAAVAAMTAAVAHWAT